MLERLQREKNRVEQVDIEQKQRYLNVLNFLITVLGKLPPEFFAMLNKALYNPDKIEEQDIQEVILETIQVNEDLIFMFDSKQLSVIVRFKNQECEVKCNEEKFHFLSLIIPKINSDGFISHASVTEAYCIAYGEVYAGMEEKIDQRAAGHMKDVRRKFSKVIQFKPVASKGYSIAELKTKI